MISTNVRPSSIIVPLDAVDPVSLNGGAAATGWLKADKYHKYAVVLALGAVADTGTPTVTAEQSAAADGSNPKALKVADAASVAYSTSDDNKQAVLDLDPLDVANGFYWFKVTVTNSVAVAALVGAVVVGVGPKYETGLAPSTV